MRVDYKRRADDCARWAAEAASEPARGHWRKMEAYWRYCAGKQDKGRDDCPTDRALTESAKG
jgi:hypothetical protein